MRKGLGALLARDGGSWRRWCGGWRGGVGLVVLALSVYLPGFWSIPPVDRDESRFAQASRQMFEAVALPEGERDAAMHSGGLVIPMVQGKARLNKPPGIYWLQVASAWVFTGGDPLRDAIWMYRVPSLLAGLVIVLVTWRIGLSMFDARAGWLGGALLAVSPVFVWEAHQARADMVMVAATVVGVWGLWGVVRGRAPRARLAAKPDEPWHPWWCAILMWVAVGVGVMVKGPVTPMVVGLTAVGYGVVSRDWRWMRRTRPVAGLAIVAVMVGPWVWAVGERVGWDVYAKTVYDEVIGRSGEAKEGHWGPPGYHTLFMLVLFWPGCMMAGLGVWRAWGRVWRVRRGRGAEQQNSRAAEQQIRRGEGGGGREGRPPLALGFLLAWLVPSWIVFELVMTKLPHYTMPLYPALALLSARAVFAAQSGRLREMGHWFWRGAMVAWFVGLVIAPVGVGLIGVGLIGLTIAQFSSANAPLLVAGGIVVAGAVWVVVRVYRVWRVAMGRGWYVGIQCAGIAVIPLLSLVVLQLAAPAGLSLSTRVAEAFRELDPGLKRPVAAVQYHEDSLVFAVRGRIERINADAVTEWISRHPDGLVVVPMYRGVEEDWGLEQIKIVGGANVTSRYGIAQMRVLERGHE